MCLLGGGGQVQMAWSGRAPRGMRESANKLTQCTNKTPYNTVKYQHTR
jgi:hypothetical protein